MRPATRYALVSAALVAAAAAPARAEVARYAVIVGDNQGEASEVTLLHAEADAQRLRDALIEVGRFAPEDVVLAKGADAESMRAALIQTNDRIRTGPSPAMLLVFYSGHADTSALHLGGTRLPLGQLEALVRGSAASFRLLIVDACRSGALTRVKGGRPVETPRIELGERLPSDGVVFWTSTAANEDAQESDDIQGSFFTHYLVSGLLGAADANHDGVVTLDETYHYAYENTLRATSRTLAGVQHATFQHEVHGMADVGLSWLAVGGRAVLTLPRGRNYLVLAGGADGAVVAEVGALDGDRSVSLRPGRYFVRGRAADHLLEGAVQLHADERRALADDELERVQYARLVRKGLGERQSSDSIEVGYTVRTPFWRGASPCQGLVAGWGVDFPLVTLSGRGLACRGAFSNAFLSATTDEYGAEARATHAWDLWRLSLSAGALAGLSVLAERFETAATAPARTSAAGHIGLTGAVALELGRGTYVSAELDALTSFFDGATGTETGARAAFSIRGNMLVGRRW